MELSEKYDLKRFENPDVLDAEIRQRLADICDLESQVSEDGGGGVLAALSPTDEVACELEKIKIEGTSEALSPTVDDEKNLIQQIEEISKKFEKKELKPHEAEELSNKLALLLLKGKDYLQGFEEDKFLWFKYKKGDAKEILDSTQTLVKILSFAVVSNSKAISFAFRYQQKLVEFSQFLLMMGCYSIAMNEAIVTNLNEALKKNKKINKKKLSQSTEKHLVSIIQRLRDQQNIMQRQEHLAKTQKELDNKQQQLEVKQGSYEEKQNKLELEHNALAEKQESLVLKQSDLENLQRGMISEQKGIVEKQKKLLGNQQEIKDLQKKYAKVLRIYGIITTILLVGLIISFLI